MSAVLQQAAAHCCSAALRYLAIHSASTGSRCTGNAATQLLDPVVHHHLQALSDEQRAISTSHWQAVLASPAASGCTGIPNATPMTLRGLAGSAASASRAAAV